MSRKLPKNHCTGLVFDEVLLVIGTRILNELADSRVAINRVVADPFRMALCC